MKTKTQIYLLEYVRIWSISWQLPNKKFSYQKHADGVQAKKLTTSEKKKKTSNLKIKIFTTLNLCYLY